MKRSHLLCCLSLLSTTLLFAVAAQAAVENADKMAGFDNAVKPFFAQHCTRCHGEKTQKGDLRVDTLVINFDSPKIMAHWERS